MRVWLPAIRAGSGSDVYVERLAALLKSAGVQPLVQWFPRHFELWPSLLSGIRAPEDVDVVHASSWHAFALARKHIPLVATFYHCVRGRGYPLWKSWLQSVYHDHWIGGFEERSLSKASAVVAISESTAREVGAEFGIHGIDVIDAWLDSTLFVPAERRRAGAPRVLIVGNRSRRKGWDLLPAFRECLDRRIELHVVAGLRATAKDGAYLDGRGIQFWSGLAEAELASLYQASDVVVSLSRYEGFGYTALEAMACAKPVVAFDVPGLRDVVVNGTTGMLLPCEDVGGVAAACHELIESPAIAQKMGEAGHARASRRFGAALAREKYLALYARVMSRAHGIE
ncbi:glycosyl transferase family 1 [Mizugakiibacter sediminis]|uniref:Glycosyl transferase family 1 n=1 Tax=Mizugakiibacter sediminis TaxID=1475481 RepID=A0A0K8QJL4_9GAMM|nr:glycosyltransferase family 4 protein [Mizugakiibacter sediminis]GAP65024.1 glycosyl transferase family 1 [Mizugakiibacter sediminis]